MFFQERLTSDQYVNDDGVTNVCIAAAAALLGESAIETIDQPSMGGEDFAFYTEQVPGCFVAVGVRNEEQGAIHSVHHPKFKVDEDALPLGAALHVAFAMRSLEELRRGG